MAVNTTDIVVFSCFPGVIGFFHDIGIGKDMAITAKTLRLRDCGCGDFDHGGWFLLSPGEDQGKKWEYYQYQKNDKSMVHLFHSKVLLVKTHPESPTS